MRMTFFCFGRDVEAKKGSFRDLTTELTLIESDVQ